MMNMLATVHQGHINGHLIQVELLLQLNFNQWIDLELAQVLLVIHSKIFNVHQAIFAYYVCAVGDPSTLTTEQYYKPTTLYSQTWNESKNNCVTCKASTSTINNAINQNTNTDNNRYIWYCNQNFNKMYQLQILIQSCCFYLLS
ncbi:unnamed protein product [Paramecium pentaurelia]|uniref:Uncharacterized protein n=1 Tax=Paramecium pentaurelia TaxID=43138 RepID=A0A8S1YLF8_9CILI|nr:unnamed protein product [Paramecium pentaurelia]